MVKNSRPTTAASQPAIIRRRYCLACQHRITTYEFQEPIPKKTAKLLLDTRDGLLALAEDVRRFQTSLFTEDTPDG